MMLHKSAFSKRTKLVAVLLGLLLCEGLPVFAYAQEDDRPFAGTIDSKAREASFLSTFIPEAEQYRRSRRKRRRRIARSSSSQLNSVSTVLRKVPAGSWGGNHISLQVAEDKATFELDCAFGTIDEPLQLNSSNRFDTKGALVKEHGGPVREGEEPERTPVRFAGWTDGKRMTLTITQIEGDRLIGEYTLELGKDPQITKCL